MGLIEKIGNEEGISNPDPKNDLTHFAQREREKT